MCHTSYDMTVSDLNPRFLFSCIQKRTEESASHCHDFVEMILVLQGKGVYTINGQDFPVTEGCLLLLNPGVCHKCSPRSAVSHPLTECHLAFTDVEYKNLPKNCVPLFRGCQILTHLPEDMKNTLFHLCGSIEQESRHYETGRYFMLKAYLIQVLCLIERYRQQELALEQETVPPSEYEFKSINRKYIVRKIQNYLEEHYREKISLDQIATNIYLSSYYISKVFKSETGDTPINYLISLRMKKAKEILEENPECTVQTVAAAVGYEDAYHFSKLFKKYYGMSPLHYKARLSYPSQGNQTDPQIN